jgi:hypothetical protein
MDKLAPRRYRRERAKASRFAEWRSRARLMGDGLLPEGVSRERKANPGSSLTFLAMQPIARYLVIAA